MPETRRMPARKATRFSKETLLYINKLLKESGIGFLPIPKSAKRDAAKTLAELNTKPLILPEIRHLILNIRHIPPYSMQNHTMRLTYIGNDDMLHYMEIDSTDMKSFITENGFYMPQYTVPQLELIYPEYRHGYGKLSRAAKENVRIRMPDAIGDIQTDPFALAAAIKDLYTTDINSNDPIFWENSDTRRWRVCNNITDCGLTVTEYVQARYAHKIISQLYEQQPFTTYMDAGHINAEIENPNAAVIYTALSEKFINTRYDNWQNERLDSSEAPHIGTPNPNAYNILTKINTPTFERNPENKNAKTFDRIRIYMGIKSKATAPNRKQTIQSYKQDIIRIALLKIEQTKRFQNYGVPVQYIHPTRMTLTNCDELEILFELKLA